MKAFCRTLATTSALAATLSVATPAIAGDIIAFHTPSKNIYCMASDTADEGSSVDCELITMTNEKPLLPQPSDCEQDWGTRFALSGKGKATMVCAGDTVRSDDAFNVPYGNLVRLSDLACAATETGLECTNNEAHGFKISKGKQEMY
jgi:hypothetical protein